MSSSKREIGKQDRRRRIVASARDLLRETGDAGLSMRAIAARAKVSLTTPYNLFGSKRGVVMAVLEDALNLQDQFSSFKGLSAIDRIFKVLSITLSIHAQEPDFYRTLWSCLLDPRGGDPDLRAQLISPNSSRFWRALLDEARADGAIAPDIDMDVLQEALSGRFAAVMLHWIMGGGTVAELEPGACLSYASTLCAYASDSFRPEIRRRMLEYQAQLLAVRRQAALAESRSPSPIPAS